MSEAEDPQNQKRVRFLFRHRLILIACGALLLYLAAYLSHGLERVGVIGAFIGIWGILFIWFALQEQSCRRKIRYNADEFPDLARERALVALHLGQSAKIHECGHAAGRP